MSLTKMTDEQYELLMNFIEENNIYDYGEDGYNENNTIFIVDDWEQLESLERFFERHSIDTENIEIAFSDEYGDCRDCNRIFRYDNDLRIVNDCELFCFDCIKKYHKESYIDGLVNNPSNANTVLNEDELKDLGFEKIEIEYKNGWYGDEDNPHEIMKQYENEYDELLFSVEYSHMFETGFSMWYRNIE